MGMVRIQATWMSSPTPQRTAEGFAVAQAPALRRSRHGRADPPAELGRAGIDGNGCGQTGGARPSSCST